MVPKGSRTAIGLIVVSTLATGTARADGPLPLPTPTTATTTAPATPADHVVERADADEKAASKDFAEGVKAFESGDFVRAGRAFDSAYQKKPHPSPLWNAARAWQRGGESAKAANAYAHFLREAPQASKDRAGAAKELERLASKLGAFEVHAAGASDIRVDGTPTIDTKTYVAPGTHTIDATFPRGDAKRVETVSAGDVLAVTLTSPAAVAAEGPVEGGDPSRARAGGRGWSPIVVVIGSTLTAIGAGISIWSGVDTLAQKSAFDDSPTQLNLDSGRERQLRTNVALGITGGFAVLTGLSAVFLVDWSRSRPPSASKSTAVHFDVGVGHAGIGGRF